MLEREREREREGGREQGGGRERARERERGQEGENVKSDRSAFALCNAGGLSDQPPKAYVMRSDKCPQKCEPVGNHYGSGLLH